MISAKNGITLVELLIALILLSVIVLAVNSINISSHSHVISSDRRAKLQNEASIALAHMNKEISRAIGNELIFGADSVVSTGNILTNNAIRVYIDSDAGGGLGDGIRDTLTDRWIAYRFSGATGVTATEYQLWYCPQCTDATCVTCNPAWATTENIIAKNIAAFTPTKPVNANSQLNNNFVRVQIVACWNPQTASLPNGTVNNPCVGMDTSMKMPSVSVN